jgi:hypothetical protein
MAEAQCYHSEKWAAINASMSRLEPEVDELLMRVSEWGGVDLAEPPASGWPTLTPLSSWSALATLSTSAPLEGLKGSGLEQFRQLYPGVLQPQGKCFPRRTRPSPLAKADPCGFMDAPSRTIEEIMRRCAQAVPYKFLWAREELAYACDRLKIKQDDQLATFAMWQEVYLLSDSIS